MPKSLTTAESGDSWMWILSLLQWLYGGPLLRSLLSPPFLEMSSYILGWIWVSEHCLELKMYSWMTLWSKKFKITEFFSWKFVLSRRAIRLHIGAFTILFSRDTLWPNSTLPFVFTQFSFFFSWNQIYFLLQLNPWLKFGYSLWRSLRCVPMGSSHVLFPQSSGCSCDCPAFPGQSSL